MMHYELIRSSRKTMSLEITKDRRLVVRAPLRASRKSIDEFVAKHESWVQKHLAAMPLPRPEPTEEEITALKKRAALVLPEKVAHWSNLTGLKPTGLKITTARKRYGSCSGKNSLCFSCFLMNCPEEAIDLVVVHELCHIKEKNHGPRFYALLARYLPDHAERKKLLHM